MTSATTNSVLLIILAVTLAVASPFLARHPLLMAWAKRRNEQQNLAAPLPPRPAPRPARPCPRVPEHETYLLTPDEEDVFAEVADELREQGYQWLVGAIDMEADQ